MLIPVGKEPGNKESVFRYGSSTFMDLESTGSREHKSAICPQGAGDLLLLVGISY